ncbi:MAG: hypothetical protein JSU86_04165, partial [Phycisphaerales bacterium]
MMRRAGSPRKTGREHARIPTPEQFHNIVVAATRVASLAEEELVKQTPHANLHPGGIISMIGEFEYSMNP